MNEKAKSVTTKHDRYGFKKLNHTLSEDAYFMIVIKEGKAFITRVSARTHGESVATAMLSKLDYVNVLRIERGGKSYWLYGPRNEADRAAWDELTSLAKVAFEHPELAAVRHPDADTSYLSKVTAAGEEEQRDMQEADATPDEHGRKIPKEITHE